MSAVMDAVAVLRSHGWRLVSDDPYTRRTFTRYCVMCADPWPCPERIDAESTIRLADQLIADYEAAHA